MITNQLEKWILTGEAKSLSFSAFGSALSSFAIPEDYSCIVTSIQAFPFIDLSDAAVLALDSDAAVSDILKRVSHYYELSSNQSDRFGFVSRANVGMFAGASGPGLVKNPIPSNSGEEISVYWFFRGENVVVRITTIPDPVTHNPTVGLPPATEAEVIMGYLPAAAIVTLIPGMGDPTGLDPLRYVPDTRQGISSTKQNFNPRPAPDSTFQNTVLTPPIITLAPLAPYCFPMLNIQYVLVKDSALTKLGAI